MNLFKEYIRIPAHRVAYILPDAEIDISDIQLGVLFIHAEWSGSAYSSFQTLNTALAESSADSIRLYIANTDDPGAKKFLNLHGKNEAGGYGESFWIRAGQIVAFLPTCNNLDALRTLIQRLTTAAE